MNDLVAHALKNNGHKCFCNHPLTFSEHTTSSSVGKTYSCHCERCERRATRIAGIVHVYGHGADPDLAFADWLEEQRRTG